VRADFPGGFGRRTPSGIEVKLIRTILEVGLPEQGRSERTGLVLLVSIG